MLKLYSSLAEWWPLLSPPEEYAEEAAAYIKVLAEAGSGPMEALVEFGSGGGNNALHMKNSFASVTLVDSSPDMIHARNPDSDTTYTVDCAYILREPDGSSRVEHDRNVEGLFARAEWIQTMSAVGFRAHSELVELADVESGSIEVFVGVKPL